MLEYFVHLDPEDPPDDLVLATADVPDSLSRERVELARYRRIGGKRPRRRSCPDWRRFVKKAETCLLLVPSALAVNENN